MNNIKTCPFCNSKAEIHHKFNKYTNAWVVECSNLSCPASYMIGNEFETEEEAIEEWNKRLGKEGE